jgi:hypothetical protein
VGKSHSGKKKPTKTRDHEFEKTVLREKKGGKVP